MASAQGGAEARRATIYENFSLEFLFLMSIQKKEKPAGTIGKKDICAALGITPQGLGKWGLKPVAKIGREVFLTSSKFA